MTRSILRVSILALGAAAFVSSSSLVPARADTSAQPAPGSSVVQAAPRPDFWVESGPDDAMPSQRPSARRHARHYPRHYAWRNLRRYAYRRDNPIAVAAIGMAGGVAELGSLAAYPFYCFPNYGSCSVRLPHRF
jgi:hypothetical protein